MAESLENRRRIEPAQWWVIGLAIAFMAGSVLYRYLTHSPYGRSAAMFIGIPAVLAVLLALTPKAKTVTGGIIKGITLSLLVIAPLLGEGYLHSFRSPAVLSRGIAGWNSCGRGAQKGPQRADAELHRSSARAHVS